MALARHFQAMARNNAWSNHRLLLACRALGPGEFGAPRTGFFPSLAATLNHILIVDWLYLDALEQGGLGRRVLDPRIPHPDFAGYEAAQRATDRRLIAFCDGLTDAMLDRAVIMDRARGPVANTVGTTLPHLFVHQIHHRGQAHAMLSGTSVPPPQLDEFFLEEDEGLRRAELDLLGL